MENSKEKVLFVIPAYNEAENIRRVLDEIKQDVSFADVVVINDGSKDDTAKIVRSCGIHCIDMVYNVGYAMAVQTGLKYAHQNHYDYVIQFDADGQHIASEAARLLQDAKDGNYDIVIGSRYLTDTGYPCPFFRRIGTKLFSGLIHLFCRKKITDPLSGFQCLNQKTVALYAQKGEYPEFPDANLLISMIYKGYSIHEISVKMRLREAGESMHGGIIKPIKYMISMFYTIVLIVIKNVGGRSK